MAKKQAKFEDYLEGANQSPKLELNLESTAKGRDLKTAQVSYGKNSPVAYLIAHLGFTGKGGADADSIAEALAAKGLIPKFDSNSKESRQRASLEVANLFKTGEIEDLASEYLSAEKVDTSKMTGGGLKYKTNATPAPFQGSSGATSGATGGAGGSSSSPLQFSPDQQKQIRETKTNSDAELASLLSDPSLSDDDREAIKTLYDAISANDEEQAARFGSAVKAGMKFADPIFKEKLKIAQAELGSALGATKKDLEYEVNSRETRLADLKKEIADRSGYLTLEEEAELRGLESQYVQDLDETRQQASEAGLTFSSKKTEKENLLATQTGELRESSKRKFGLQQRGLDRTLQTGERDTAAEIARLQEISKGKMQDITRKAEAGIGTANLPGSARGDALGGIIGDEERNKTKEALNFANSFVL